MRRFEKRDRHGLEIFWQVERRGATVDRTWGFLEKGEQFTSLTFRSEPEAEQAVLNLCRQRLASGYVEVRPHQLDPSVAVPLDDAALDALILESPDDPELYQVLADQLQAAGHPIGELSVVQLEQHFIQQAGITADDRSGLDRLAQLSRLEHQLLDAHTEALLGPLVRLLPNPKASWGSWARKGRVRVTWRWGWVHRLTIAVENPQPADIQRRIRRAPACRFLRELHFVEPVDTEAWTDLPATVSVIETPRTGR